MRLWSTKRSLFDRVIIGIGNNTSKQGLLTVENRKRLIDDIYRGDERVEACIYTGLTGEFAEAAGACAIIRGVRNTTGRLQCVPYRTKVEKKRKNSTFSRFYSLQPRRVTPCGADRAGDAAPCSSALRRS